MSPQKHVLQVHIKPSASQKFVQPTRNRLEAVQHHFFPPPGVKGTVMQMYLNKTRGTFIPPRQTPAARAPNSYTEELPQQQ